MFARYLNARFLPTNTNLGLLLLRVGTGLILFLRHGWEKVSRLSLTNPHFPDPLHIGQNLSWTLALLSDGVFSLLLILGLGTRWVALYCFVNILVAWALVHHFAFLGKGPGSDHGELIALYLSALLTLMITGPGSHSLDEALSRRADRQRFQDAEQGKA